LPDLDNAGIANVLEAVTDSSGGCENYRVVDDNCDVAKAELLKTYMCNFEDALAKVREYYPSARAEGSTFDWSFLVGGDVVAEMTTHRSERPDAWWELVIFNNPKVPTHSVSN
jgi:hypothetical protein